MDGFASQSLLIQQRVMGAVHPSIPNGRDDQATGGYAHSADTIRQSCFHLRA